MGYLEFTAGWQAAGKRGDPRASPTQARRGLTGHRCDSARLPPRAGLPHAGHQARVTGELP
jgi:hypothetical protein